MNIGNIKKKIIKVKPLKNFKGSLPEYASEYASGFDVKAQLEEPLELKKSQRSIVPTGLSFDIPIGFEIQVRPRSGLAINDGLAILNSPGTIDADYRGEVKIIVINLGNKKIIIQDQERIAQLVLVPIFHAKLIKVNSLKKTKRNLNGFGSTGK